MPKEGSRGSHRLDPAADETATETVVRAHTTLRNSSPIDLSPVTDAIPCDALERLVGAGNEVTVTFTYEGMKTTLHDDGEIVVHDRE
ncbi:HalOD1 output domain-containing protein [Natrinema sp. 1APR25-10V2]|uniref:HalOD1 output domain-containing protein n=1 Tax=Natrinema sp. 1APR25-10V2 TaxID=2951081 RepID=UPI00287B6F61|nr:HalOD1 output domain-containing protein [Natrinema sp. 1APR25-10V2]